ncbi:MAG: hypothetical protein VW338_04720 [Rhodospirillaceae bacterium]
MPGPYGSELNPVRLDPWQNIVEVGWASKYLIAGVTIDRRASRTHLYSDDILAAWWPFGGSSMPLDYDYVPGGATLTSIGPQQVLDYVDAYEWRPTTGSQGGYLQGTGQNAFSNVARSVRLNDTTLQFQSTGSGFSEVEGFADDWPVARSVPAEEIAFGYGLTTGSLLAATFPYAKCTARDEGGAYSDPDGDSFLNSLGNPVSYYADLDIEYDLYGRTITGQDAGKKVATNYNLDNFGLPSGNTPLNFTPPSTGVLFGETHTLFTLDLSGVRGKFKGVWYRAVATKTQTREDLGSDFPINLATIVPATVSVLFIREKLLTPPAP